MSDNPPSANAHVDDRTPTDSMAEALSRGPGQATHFLVHWDMAGVRFDSAYVEAVRQLYCFIPEEDCRSEEPGWDFANVVTSYEIKTVLQAEDSAIFEIAFQQVGRIDQDGFTRVDSTARDTVRFKRIKSRWRIVGVDSQLEPHLSKASTYRLWSKAVADSSKLRSELDGAN
jgi:hypothetical protein